MKSKRQKSKPLKILITVKNTVLSVLIVVLVLIIAATMYARITGGTPSLMGYSLFRVSSGSMEPELKVGDIVVVKACEAAELKQGDIITYNGKQGSLKDRIVTHRIVTAPYAEGTKTFVVTRGDANSADDPPVNTSDIVGRYVSKVELLKTVYDIFITPWGLLILIALIILAFFNEIVIFVKSLMGIGYVEESDENKVEDIIERYRLENERNGLPEKSDTETDNE